MTPRVSVVIPSRNRRSQLAVALASVDAQDYRDLELIVIDDASEDDTATWLRHARPDVRLIALPTPIGAAAARNRAMAIARGDLVAFLDDDDRWAPSYLEAQVASLDADRCADLSYAGHIDIDREDRRTWPDRGPVWDYKTTIGWMLAECFIHTMSVVVCRRTAVERVGSFDETLTIVHDFEWYARLLAAGVSFAHVPRVLVERRVPGGLVTVHRRWWAEERAVIQRTLGVGAVPSADARIVRASRALFFARLAAARGDWTFALTRGVDALAVAPMTSTRIAVRRLRRRLAHATRQPALAPGEAGR